MRFHTSGFLNQQAQAQQGFQGVEGNEPQHYTENLRLFKKNCLATFDECKGILGDRGTQYDQHEDGWKNAHFAALKATYRALDLGTDRDQLSQDELITIASAALVDQKISRMVGDYKEDTAVDLINYLANWVGQMKKYKKNAV